ncbi:hypothetical protein D3C87_2080190 [compost metagenome]
MRHDQLAVAEDAGHGCLQIGKQFAQLLQRRVDHRAIFHALDRQHGDAVVGKAHDIRRARERYAPQHQSPDLDLG